MSELGNTLVKLSKVLDLGADRPQPTAKKVDAAFTTLSRIKEAAMFEELVALNVMTSGLAIKLAAVSDAQAQDSLTRLESLERSRPTLRQAGRYGAIGAIAAPLASSLSNVVRGKSPVEGLRETAAKAMGGAITGGAVPLLRSHMDRSAEVGTLRSYMNERRPGQ